MSRFPELDILRFLGSAKARADPYPLYASLRERDPVHHSVLGMTIVTRYDDCTEVLRHPAMSNRDGNADIRFRAGRHGRGVVLEAPGRAMYHLERRRFRRTGPAREPLRVR